MTTRLTITELDQLHPALSIEGQEFLRRMLRTDILVYEDALPEYLEWRDWEFADKQHLEYERQERDIMAGKVTYTKAVDDYVDDVPAVDVDDDGPTPPDREGEWDDDAKAAQPVGIPTPSRVAQDAIDDLDMLPEEAWLMSVGESLANDQKPLGLVSTPDKALFEREAAELLSRDYVLQQFEAVKTNGAVLYVGCFVAREFYRR